MPVDTPSNILDSVENYYGKVLSSTKDLKTSACCAATPPPGPLRRALALVPDAVTERFYGCGSPIPLGIDGLRVLDLGSGSGRDCYVAASLVGPTGSVVGIDMTDEQLNVARANIDVFAQSVGFKPNLEFRKGYIERVRDSGIEDNSVDLIISNCVVNLSPAKREVIEGAFKALKVGGEFYFSDVYADRRLPEEVRKHEVLFGECIAGALYIEDFKRICHSVGFLDPREVTRSPIAVTDPALSAVVGPAKFYSITYRLFKVEGLETLCEDYGQEVVYKGTLPGSENEYALDRGHVFPTNVPIPVCGNTAAMVAAPSWLSRHFEVRGDTSVHQGLCDCSGGGGQNAEEGGMSAGVCGPGGCC